MSLGRRALIKMGLGASTLALVSCAEESSPKDTWWQGDVQHILPLVSHRSMNIKISFNTARDDWPILRVGGLSVAGHKSDSHGRFWAFRCTDLAAGENYTLQLLDSSSDALCDSWPLATFPDDSQGAEELSIAAFTCAGGPDIGVLPGGWHGFKPVAYRQKLFALLLAKKPDLVVANGDHIYWDYHSWVANLNNRFAKKAMRYFLGRYGHFDDSKSVAGTLNEGILTNIADEQLAGIYGVRFRSTPVVFITDDHDYFDNDDATPEKVTFPPNEFHQQLRSMLQRLYFPEFIVEDESDAMLPGVLEQTAPRLSTHFGVVQYGNLFAGVFYDCGGMISLEGDSAGLIPASVETWLSAKTAMDSTIHFAHFPSHPMGWTAGKWREWYPDILDSAGALTTAIELDEAGNKYMWQGGWWQQHQRILTSIAAQENRKPLIISGDLHLLGAGHITRSGNLDFSAQPITSILSGPVGIGDLGWLSAARGVTVDTPQELDVTDIYPPQERNGFTVITLDNQRCHVELFAAPAGFVEPEDLALESVTKFEV